MGLREVREETAELGDQPVYYRRAGDDEIPVLFLHGVPTSSDDWVPFLQRCGGIAPDLPGFGRSGKRGDGDFTMEGYADFIDRFLDMLGIERVHLCVHDWGVVGLVWAMRDPSRVKRLVVMNGVPLLPGYRWHRAARLWRMRGVGEFAMGLSIKSVVGASLKEAMPQGGPAVKALRDQVMEHFDQGTQRAILKLYRTSPPDALAAAGTRLGTITAPALVLWGDDDPYIPSRFGSGYAAALGDAQLELVEGAGHWPWLDRPELVERVRAHLMG
ncbi:MAG: alpha/beta hydrolase [Solirubrobacteraceae bacterium]|nr:alpha/beta hydrolase [Solirubrobacteraceae bacterium]